MAWNFERIIENNLKVDRNLLLGSVLETVAYFEVCAR